MESVATLFSSRDWLVFAACMVAIFLPALFFARRAGRNTSEFFASGRAAPWWLIGTSMVATTFAADTPGLVTQLVREDGIAGNWVWWAFLLTGMATVFFYARLWRRAGMLTDLEFYELRYGGKPARLVRGFRALYLGVVFNGCIMATVTLAAVKIAATLFGIPAWQTIVAAVIACSLISSVSGLWGVLVSDLVQFALALTGAVAAAVYALQRPEVGGLMQLWERIDVDTLRIIPAWDNRTAIVTLLVIPLAVQTWAAWYPGSEPGGGSYVAQRLLAARNERHALGAALWFNIANFALRPWPWIIVALASMLVFPSLDDLRRAFPQIHENLLNHDVAYPAMLTLLPPGILGLTVASLLAAYISTMSTHLNWGASYLVHDFYRRFVVPDASEKHYVRAGRVATVGLMVLAGCLVQLLESARDGFNVILSIGAGTGLIYLLRWYWWRINAWSEIAAMIGSFVVATSLYVAKANEALEGLSGNHILLVTVGVTTAIWLAVTAMTRPESDDQLELFYRKVRPAGPGWRRLRDARHLPPSRDRLGTATFAWTLGCVTVYAAMFGVGAMLMNRTVDAMIYGVVVVACGLALFRVTIRLTRGQMSPIEAGETGAES